MTAAEIFSTYPWLATVAGLALLALLGWLVDTIVKRQLIKLVGVIASKSESTWDDIIVQRKVIHRAVQVLPAMVIYAGIPWVPGISADLLLVLRNAALAYMVLVLLLAVSASLSSANDIWDLREDARQKPIKGYVQLLKIVLFCVGAILVVSIVFNKSPLLLLSGFGALTAILLLIFKDTILSLVASVQLSSLDMVRVGDWIEMPQFSADGDVIDVALHTIRIQNWDKTITTIPTHRLISDSFRNWRGMSESGGRRIKRALNIDMSSVRFLNEQEVAHFQRFALLDDYINDKQKELNDYNSELDSPTAVDVNLRRLTNMGMLRAYVFNYLKNHPDIHDAMTLLVRQLQPTPDGLPLEIYCFTTTTNWNEYEAIQGDIFDHLLAILDEFDLAAFQQPSGHNLELLGSSNPSPSPHPSARASQ